MLAAHRSSLIAPSAAFGSPNRSRMAAPSLGSACPHYACRFRGFPPSARAARHRKRQRGRAVAARCQSPRMQTTHVSSIGSSCTAASGPAGGGAQWPAPGRRLGRIHVPVRYPALRNSFGILFSTPQSDIWGGMLASELVVQFWSAAQTSDAAWANQRQGGCGVGGKLRTCGQGIGKLASALPSWSSRTERRSKAQHPTATIQNREGNVGQRYQAAES